MGCPDDMLPEGSKVMDDNKGTSGIGVNICTHIFGQDTRSGQDIEFSNLGGYSRGQSIGFYSVIWCDNGLARMGRRIIGRCGRAICKYELLLLESTHKI